MAKKCIPGVICFENITIVIILLIICIFIYYIYKFSPSRTSYASNASNTSYDDNARMMMMPPPPPPPPSISDNRGFVFNNSFLMPPRMNDTLLDPYNPPLRDNSYLFGGRGMVPINIPTQGPPPQMMAAMMMREEYQQVGLLTRANGSEMILPLMGQPLYTNRDKWNYYTMSDKNNIVKLPINYRGKNCMNEYGCDSLNSGDHVHVEGYNDKFKVTIYDNKLMRYLPVI